MSGAGSSRSLNGWPVATASPTTPRSNKVRFIRKAQALGFSLDEIQRIMSLRGVAKTCRRVVAMAEATLSETQAKLKELEHFRDALAQSSRSLETKFKKGPSGILHTELKQTPWHRSELTRTRRWLERDYNRSADAGRKSTRRIINEEMVF